MFVGKLSIFLLKRNTASRIPQSSLGWARNFVTQKTEEGTEVVIRCSYRDLSLYLYIS